MGVSAFMESCLWPSVLHGELKGETSNRLCSVGCYACRYRSLLAVRPACSSHTIGVLREHTFLLGLCVGRGGEGSCDGGWSCGERAGVCCLRSA